jgi:CBS domain-containing protein
MTQFHIRHLPVVDDGKPVGMVSDRDLLAAIGKWSDSQLGEFIPGWADRLLAHEVMSRPLLCVFPGDPVEKAACMMLSEKVNALPILDGTRLLGIVTETDFLKCFLGRQNWQRQSVEEHMTARVFHVGPKEPVRGAWRLMRDKHIRHLIVLEEPHVVGILSDRDLLAGITWNASGRGGIQDHVGRIMTRDVAKTDRRATLTEVARIMVARKIGALPVFDRSELVGIISESDLVKAFVASSADRTW